MPDVIPVKTESNKISVYSSLRKNDRTINFKSKFQKAY